ncbi:MAG: hypothetical protein IKN06_08675 [Bacteroidales bacterium]|nr:hypothetical protein [Bacteroidales bacterium]
MKKILFAACLLGSLVAAGAQEKKSGSMPPEDYYLMPSFGKGMVYFSGQAPAQGELNICAVDNTLRFKDENGKELVATNEETVVKVQIDTVVFLRYHDVYYRMYPVTGDVGVALRRNVLIETDAKTGAYGGVSRTSSIREYGTLYTEGMAYKLDGSKEYPYSVNEVLYLYKGNKVLLLSKKNLRKLFPDRKAEIDAFFKSGGSMPRTLSEAMDFLSRWAGKE